MVAPATRDATPAWSLNMQQAIALLKHRCQLIGFDRPLDEEGLLAGSAASCTSVIRFLFTRFSEALFDHLGEKGITFDDRMSDEQLADASVHCSKSQMPESTLCH